MQTRPIAADARSAFVVLPLNIPPVPVTGLKVPIRLGGGLRSQALWYARGFKVAVYITHLGVDVMRWSGKPSVHRDDGV